jgi:hypothetical protein
VLKGIFNFARQIFADAFWIIMDFTVFPQGF